MKTFVLDVINGQLWLRGFSMLKLIMKGRLVFGVKFLYLLYVVMDQKIRVSCKIMN